MHGLAALLLIVTLGFYASEYTAAFFAALAQVGVGFLSYESVNASASKPGAVIPLHQLMTILVAVSIFYAWSFRLPLLG